MVIIEKKLQQRWNDYIENLFCCHRREKPTMHINNAEPVVLKSEINTKKNDQNQKSRSRWDFNRDTISRRRYQDPEDDRNNNMTRAKYRKSSVDLFIQRCLNANESEPLQTINLLRNRAKAINMILMLELVAELDQKQNKNIIVLFKTL